MRTNLTVSDIKEIVEAKFNNEVVPLVLKNEDGVEETVSLADWLNITFYAWEHRISGLETFGENNAYSGYEDYIEQLTNSLNTAFALVDVKDSEATPSQDIDYAAYTCAVEFFIQTEKANKLDYFVNHIRNKNFGVQDTYTNEFGDNLSMYYNFGTLIYADEPMMTQFGECVRCTMNFTVTYLTQARGYNDYVFSMSLDGGTNYYSVPLTKASLQKLFTLSAVPRQNRPDMTGFVASSLSSVFTISLYDFNKPLTNSLDDYFWQIGAYKIDDVETTAPADVGKVALFKVKTNANDIAANQHTYTYKVVIDNISKEITNSGFNITSITLKTSAK